VRLAQFVETAVKAEASDQTWIAIARLVRPRGRKGELIAEVLTDFPERFDALRRVSVERAEGGEPVPAEIKNCWWHERRLILQFEGIETIDQAELLRGRLVMLPRGERIALGEGRYYQWEVEGCEVFEGPHQRRLGKVAGIETTGGVDLLRIELPGAGRSEVLVPFALAICREIDVRARRIVIDPPEGLVELNEKAGGER
jgi:16S rRNA processing protein RimM